MDEQGQTKVRGVRPLGHNVYDGNHSQDQATAESNLHKTESECLL